MVEVEGSLFLVSRERLARLTKTIQLTCVPQVQEMVKLVNREMGDYFRSRSRT